MFNRIVIYVINETQEDSFSVKLSAIRLAEEFANKVRNIFGDVSIGIGRCYENVANAKKSYREAMQALQYLSRSNDYILHIDDVLNEYEEEYETDQEIENEINEKVARGDVNSALVAFDRIFDDIVLDTSGLEDIKDKCIVILVGLSKRWDHIRYDFRKVLNKIINAGTTEELRNVLRMFIEKTTEKVALSHQEKVNSIIAAADEYMLKNYAKDITLEDIARAVNLSPYYFSRFYKEQSGVNFIDRLTAIRIEKAKEYFMNTDLSLKEVSGLVGYQDPNYFSKLFKKITGYTVTEFKESYRK